MPKSVPTQPPSSSHSRGPNGSDRAEYEHRCQSPVWQERAQALLEVRDGHYYKLWTYRDTPANREAGRVGRTYPSMGAFAMDLPEMIADKTAYGTAKLAEVTHFKHYPLLRTAPITATFAKRLYTLPIGHPLIDLLLLYMHLGGRDELAQPLLKEAVPDPVAAARTLLAEHVQRVPAMLEQARSLVGD